jgi:hypothetical protein
MLAGCGGSQPPTGAPGAMPQTSALATHTDRGKSWMLPEAGRDLLYMSGGDQIFVYSYPQVKYLKAFTLPYDSAGDPVDFCSDQKGDVFIPTYEDGGDHTSYIFEYAHGATVPKETLTINEFNALGCSVDSKSGNLAISGWTGKPSSLRFSFA